jgi:CubicO group peptidase (beta-lactamase class C family)
MRYLFIFLIVGFLSVYTAAQTDEKAVRKLEIDMPRLMKLADVPGASVALIRDGKIVWSKAFGVADAETNEPVTNDSVFEAASLSKVVFAYGVLKLVDEGKLDLDAPLNKYLGNNYEVGDEPRLGMITARRVLSHTAGFPNWRAEENKPLPILFTPGERFRYSGEGFLYLQRVVEKITGLPPEDFMRKTVFVPLEMTSSSFVWQLKYEKTAVYRHDWLGRKVGRGTGKLFIAPVTLRTTARDFAAFLTALLNGKGLEKKTFKAMFAPQIRVDENFPQLFWGLGVGLEITGTGEYVWHWGDQGNNKAYFTADLKKRDAVVFFANGANGLSFIDEILAVSVGGEHPGAKWQNYPRYDSPERSLLKAIIEKGATEPLRNYLEARRRNPAQNIDEARINLIGYRLLELKKTDDAIQIFTQNTIDFPKSWNAWDSLAEAYVTLGDNENAIKYYEKSLELDPNNKNAAEQLKKLKP